ncbi:hypothetical protein AGMMS49573_10840 [Endomicrobiia bacterium]|nr:hypothetical protein AGMMS49573_10840 [Endomicrobiia bacterium]
MENTAPRRYKAIPENMYHPDIGEYVSYGLQSDSEECVHDISTYKEFAERLATVLTERQLSPVHLLETIADMIP